MSTATESKLTQDILHGDMWSLLRRFSLPAIIGMSINGINAFFDGLFVGQFVGETAVAAISLAFPLTFITGGISAMIGVGGSSLLSQAIGSGDADKQRSILGTCTGLSLVTSILLMVLGITFAPEMIGFLGGSGEILELGVQYYRITLIGAFFRIHAVAINMLIRAEGKVELAMYMSMSAALLNIMLNYTFMGILDWGISGAAWATVTSMTVFTIGGYLYYFLGKANYQVDPRSIRIRWSLAKPMLAIGISAAMLQIMFFVQQSIVFLIIKNYGGDWDIAFMGTSYRVMLLMVFPSFGFAIAFQPVAGINYGAKMIERVIDGFKKFLSVATLAMFIPWIFMMIFPATVIGWMLPNAVLSADDIFNFRMFILTLPIFPSFFLATTLFQAAGKAKVAGALTITRDLIFFLPFALLLPMYFGVAGIYLVGIPINIITVGLVGWLLTRTFGQWRREALSPVVT